MMQKPSECWASPGLGFVSFCKVAAKKKDDIFFVQRAEFGFTSARSFIKKHQKY